MPIDKLLSMFEGKNERVGFVLTSGEVVECTNISETPEESFLVSPDEAVLYADDATSTWHTHPGRDNNLSMMDYEMFLSWNTLTHFIVGVNGVKQYYVENGDVLIA